MLVEVVAGTLGRQTAWTTSANNPKAAAAMKAARQPNASPIKAPSGGAAIVAAETPRKITDIPLPKPCMETSRTTVAPARAQNPPMATPRSMRAPNSTQ
jgi:hypothetical protein